MKIVIGILLAAAGLFTADAPTRASTDTVVERAMNILMADVAYVDPALARLVRRDRLAYAARIASRAADGRRIVIAFVQTPDARLNDFRERLYRRLELRSRSGTLIVATPTSITMHTPNLTPDAELAIIRLDGAPLKVTPRPYTETLAELVYDTGLVIHNTTPGAVPRGFGRERNLATFPGHFAGEGDGGGGLPWVPLGSAFAAILIVGAALAVRRRNAS